MIIYMLDTPHASLTLFTSHSVAKCVSPNKDYYYLEYRFGLLFGRPLQSLWTTVELSMSTCPNKRRDLVFRSVVINLLIYIFIYLF